MASSVQRSPTWARASASGEAARRGGACALVSGAQPVARRDLPSMLPSAGHFRQSCNATPFDTLRLAIASDSGERCVGTRGTPRRGRSCRRNGRALGGRARPRLGSRVRRRHAPGAVLTNAHVLRGEEVAVDVRRRPHRAGRVAGADADLDLAAIAVDTGDAPPVAWEPERPMRSAIGEPVFALANPGGRGLRATFGLVSRDRALVPRPARAPHRRLDRAHRAAAARLLGRPARRRRGPAARPQLDPARGRADPRPARRRRDAAAGRGARRRGGGGAARGSGIAIAPAARRAADARRGRAARARRPARARGRGGQPRGERRPRARRPARGAPAASR